MLVQDRIRIHAPRSVVWEVTTDIEKWPEWTPTVTSAVRVDEGPFNLGSSVKIKQPGQPDAVWTVTEFVPEERFVWETRRPGLSMQASHNLTADGKATTSILRVDARGALVLLLWPVLRWAIPGALRDENKGLKKRCENTLRTTSGIKSSTKNRQRDE